MNILINPAGGHYVYNRANKLTIGEMCSLFGIDPKLMLKAQQKSNSSDAVVGAALGNAMSLNVLERVLGSLLFSAGLVKKRPVDVWQEAANAAKQRSTPPHNMLKFVRDVRRRLS